MPYLVTLTPCITRLFILPKTEFYTKIAIAANVEKGGKVDGVVEQVLGLLHHDIKEI